MEDIITVIVPVYKVENYLTECVDSIINQTYKNLEIILVDDGSPDSCGSICDEYIKADSRIKVIHKENGGLSDARNAGLAIASGEIISFVDSDDYLSPVFLEVMHKAMVEGNCDIVAIKGGTDFWDGEELVRPLTEKTSDAKIEYLEAKKVLEKMFYQQIATGAQFKLYKKHILNGVKFPIGYVYEDVATTYKAFLNSQKAAVVYADLYAYRKRRDSIIRQKFSEKKLVCLKIFEQLINDEGVIKIGLQRAAKSRVYAMTYSVFLQVEPDDKKTKRLLWNKLKTIQKDIMFDSSTIMRKKNKYAAWISVLGMEASYLIGRKFGQKDSMG